ncbi:MAG: molybdenum cofactor biosynthesis protein MoaE [Planctomycetaceae bacterium]
MLVARDVAGSVRDAGAGALVRGPVEPDLLRAAVADPAAGATVVFTGTARGVTAGVATRSLEYEAHEPLAEASRARLCAAAVARFGLVACAVEHRLGGIGIGEVAVSLATSAPHRAAAFAAAEWLMERIKAEVPIWKREEWADGRREWIHPGVAPDAVGGGAA